MKNSIIKIKKILLEGQYFEYAFLIAMMSISIPVVHQYTGPYAKITLFWGGICILYDILVTKRLFQCRYYGLIIGFGGIWLLSVLAGYQDNFVRNLVFFAYGMIYIWLLYPKFFREKFAALSHFLTAYCVLTFAASSVSVGMFISLYRTTLSEEYIIGYHMGRLYGVYVSPNTGGMYALLAVVASIIILYATWQTQKRWVKALHFLNIFVQVSYISLTDSKGTQITYMVFALFVGFGICYVRKKKTVIHVLLSILTGVLFMGASIGGTHLLGTAYSYVPALLNQTGEVDEETDKKLEAIAIKRQYEDSDFASGRVELWKVGAKLIRENPVLGTPRETMQSVAEQLVPGREEVTDKLHSGMHNLYMETLVETGVTGGLIFFSFIILTGIRLARSFFSLKDDRKKHARILFIAFVASMAVNNLGECTILFCQSAIGIVFWLMLGYGLSHWTEEKQEC